MTKNNDSTVMLYLGTSEERSKDEKGRVTIPSEFRKVIQKRNKKFKDEILTEKFGDYKENMLQVSCIETNEGIQLSCCSIPDFYKKTEEYLNMILTDEDRRKIYQLSAIVSFDNQGRMLIPKNLMKAASLEEKVIFTGNGDVFSIIKYENEKTKEK